MTTWRIMTFNIRGSDYPDGDNNWEHRADLNVEVIEGQHADIIGFQEYQPGNQVVYDRRLPGYAYAIGPAVARENEANPYYCAIYWRSDRFTLTEQGEFFLSSTPDVYSLDWGIGHGRGVNWVQLHDRHTDMALLVANTHMPHDSEEGRIRGAHLIVSKLAALAHARMPVIVTGDFNSRPTVYQEHWRDLLTPEQRRLLDDNWYWFGIRNNVYEIFRAAGYTDTFIEAGNIDNPYVTTGHDFLQGDDLLPLNFRIDWILTRSPHQPIKCRSCSIINTARPPLYPSDHCPVVADLEVMPPAQG